jgi:hypothetical protein
VTFHDATNCYSLSETDAGDERIGIGDTALRSAAIWQKDWDVKPFLYKVYEPCPRWSWRGTLPDRDPFRAAVAARPLVGRSTGCWPAATTGCSRRSSNGG